MGELVAELVFEYSTLVAISILNTVSAWIATPSLLRLFSEFHLIISRFYHLLLVREIKVSLLLKSEYEKIKYFVLFLPLFLFQIFLLTYTWTASKRLLDFLSLSFLAFGTVLRPKLVSHQTMIFSSQKKVYWRWEWWKDNQTGGMSQQYSQKFVESSKNLKRLKSQKFEK